MTLNDLLDLNENLRKIQLDTELAMARLDEIRWKICGYIIHWK